MPDDTRAELARLRAAAVDDLRAELAALLRSGEGQVRRPVARPRPRRPRLLAPARNAPDAPEDAHNRCRDALAYWTTTKALTGAQPRQSWNRPPTTAPKPWLVRR